MDALAGTALATAEPPTALHLSLHPDDAAPIWRDAALAAWRAGRRPGRVAVSVAWHDTPDNALAGQGLVVTEQRAGGRAHWRIEGLYPAALTGSWAAAAPPPILTEAPSRDALLPAVQQLLHLAAPPALAEVGRFEGERRHLSDPDAGSALSVCAGTVQGGGNATAACRVVLEGGAAAAFAQAHALAGSLRLAVPATTLAAQAAALRGAAIPPRHLGAPVLGASATVDDALAALIGQLADVLLHWAPLAGADRGAEPVHQMRVALRRLRSALKLFSRPAPVEGVQESLRTLARALGGARDWDVFLGGLGRAIAAAFPEERAIRRMLVQAERQRRARYAELAAVLNGAEFRRTLLRLAELAATRPWRGCDPANPERAAALAGGVAGFGREALARRLRRVLRAGGGFSQRSLDDLHALRIQCKRLRYACELFAPAYPGQAAGRFMRRLAAVQERLGHLNDGAVAAGLLAELGGGAGRATAAGLVRGYTAAHEAQARERARRAWRRFRRTAPFWT